MDFTLQSVLDPGDFTLDETKTATKRAAEAEKMYGGVDASGVMLRESNRASQFGQRGQKGYNRLGIEADSERGYLRDTAHGQNSVSAAQLRQGLQQNIAGQQAMAASARPNMAPMAARQASMAAANLGSGLGGQQAVAGLQERQQAQQQYQQALLAQRQQDLQATTSGQSSALSGYGAIEQQRGNRYGAMLGVNPGPSSGDKTMAVGSAIAQMYASSDIRLKKDVKSGDKDAQRLLKGLRAYTFKYKSEKHGEGRQLGIMAHELEKAGLKQAVIDTPEGKMVHGAKLATALAATLPGLNKRLAKLEAGR